MLVIRLIFIEFTVSPALYQALDTNHFSLTTLEIDTAISLITDQESKT